MIADEETDEWVTESVERERWVCTTMSWPGLTGLSVHIMSNGSDSSRSVAGPTILSVFTMSSGGGGGSGHGRSWW